MIATIWLITVPLSVATYAMRSGFILWGTRHQLPPVVERALDFVPAAILAALVVPALVLGGPALNFSPIKLAAGVLAAAAHWRYRKVLLTALVGMCSLWAIQAIS